MKQRFFLFIGLSVSVHAAETQIVEIQGNLPGTKQASICATTEAFEKEFTFVHVKADRAEAAEETILYRSCACGPGETRDGDLEELNKEMTAVNFWEDPNGAGQKIKRTESSKAKPGDLDFPRQGEPGYVEPGLSVASIAALSLRDDMDSSTRENGPPKASDPIVQAMDRDIQDLLETPLVQRVVGLWKWVKS